MTLEFIKTAEHPLVTLIEKKMKEASFEKSRKEVIQKLSKDFDPDCSVLFRTPGEDYLEWVDILEATSSAKGRFVMFELGAGYGRWCINAMHALQLLNPVPFHFVAVEADAAHFRFLQEYFAAHGLSPSDYRLINAAVDEKAGHAIFHMGESNEWYGQYIDGEKATWLRRLLYSFQKLQNRNKKRKEVVKTITLNSLLDDYDFVDLIDMDIQSSELPVLKSSISELNKKVKRVHVGTHKPEIDVGLKNLFLENNWKNVHLYPSFSKSTTPYGLIDFNDGIQSWINPKFE